MTSSLANSIQYLGKPLTLPAKLGTIQQAFQGQRKFVIHVQDLHCNFEVQKNIAGLIDFLAQEHGLKWVGEEGAFAAINTGPIRDFPLSQIRQEVSDYFVQQGRLTGAEYYSGNGEHTINLEGVETPKLYNDSLQAVRSFLNSESQGYCFDLREQLDSLKPGIYNQALLALDADRTAYRQGKLDVLGYAWRLQQQAAKQGIQLEPYPQLSQYVQTGRADFNGNMDAEKLFREMDKLDQALRLGQYTADTQRELDAQYHRLDIIEKLLNISATQEEQAEFRQAPEKFKVTAFINFIGLCWGAIHRAQDETAELDQDIYALDGYLKHVWEFYQLADLRSQHFVANVIRKMDSQNENLGLVITGGFHTEGMLAELKRQGIGYISIKPALTQQDRVNPYFALLQGRQLPIEKLLAKNQTTLAVRSSLESTDFTQALALTFGAVGLGLMSGLKPQQQQAVQVYLNENRRIIQIEPMTSAAAAQLGITVPEGCEVCQALTESGAQVLMLIGRKEWFTRANIRSIQAPNARQEQGDFNSFGSVGIAVFPEQAWSQLNQAAQAIADRQPEVAAYWRGVLVAPYVEKPIYMLKQFFAHPIIYLTQTHRAAGKYGWVKTIFRLAGLVVIFALVPAVVAGGAIAALHALGDGRVVAIVLAGVAAVVAVNWEAAKSRTERMFMELHSLWNRYVPVAQLQETESVFTDEYMPEVASRYLLQQKGVTIIRQVARREMREACVYEAVDASGKHWALKIGTENGVLRNFIMESVISRLTADLIPSSLIIPAQLGTISLNSTRKIEYQLTEWMDGSLLLEFLKTEGKSHQKTPGERASLLAKVFAETMKVAAYYHAHDIVHGDLGAQNTFITQDEQIKVFDPDMDRAMTVDLGEELDAIDQNFFGHFLADIFDNLHYPPNADFEIKLMHKIFTPLKAEMLRQRKNYSGVEREINRAALEMRMALELYFTTGRIAGFLSETPQDSSAQGATRNQENISLAPASEVSDTMLREKIASLLINGQWRTISYSMKPSDYLNPKPEEPLITLASMEARMWLFHLLETVGDRGVLENRLRQLAIEMATSTNWKCDYGTAVQAVITARWREYHRLLSVQELAVIAKYRAIYSQTWLPTCNTPSLRDPYPLSPEQRFTSLAEEGAGQYRDNRHQAAIVLKLASLETDPKFYTSPISFFGGVKLPKGYLQDVPEVLRNSYSVSETNGLVSRLELERIDVKASLEMNHEAWQRGLISANELAEMERVFAVIGSEIAEPKANAGRGTSYLWFLSHNWVRLNLFELFSRFWDQAWGRKHAVLQPLTWDEYKARAWGIENNYLWLMIGLAVAVASVFVAGDAGYLAALWQQVGSVGIGSWSEYWAKYISLGSWLALFVGSHYQHGAPQTKEEWKANIYAAWKIFWLLVLAHWAPLWVGALASYAFHKIINSKIDLWQVVRTWLSHMRTELISAWVGTVVRTTGLIVAVTLLLHLVLAVSKTTNKLLDRSQTVAAAIAPKSTSALTDTAVDLNQQQMFLATIEREHPQLWKCFSEDVKKALGDDPALRPVFMVKMPDDKMGQPEHVNSKIVVGGKRAEDLIREYSSFSVGEPESATAWLESGAEIIVGVTDFPNSKGVNPYSETANGRTAYFPLPDGTWLGIKGSGQFQYKDEPAFYWNQARDGFWGLVTEDEAINAAQSVSPFENTHADFGQFLGCREVYALPDTYQAGQWQNPQTLPGASIKPYMTFYRVATPHRLSEIAVLLKNDPGLNNLAKKISKALISLGKLQTRQELTGVDLIKRIVANMGRNAAIKENLGWYKETYHDQDWTMAAEEMDREELYPEEGFKKLLRDNPAYSSILSLPLYTFVDMEENMYIITSLIVENPVEKADAISFPDRDDEFYLRLLLASYIEGLNGKKLKIIARNPEVFWRRADYYVQSQPDLKKDIMQAVQKVLREKEQEGQLAIDLQAALTGHGASWLWFLAHNWMRVNVFELFGRLWDRAKGCKHTALQPLSWSKYQTRAWGIENNYLWLIIGLAVAVASAFVAVDAGYLSTLWQQVGSVGIGSWSEYWAKYISLGSWLVLFVLFHYDSKTPGANRRAAWMIFTVIALSHFAPLWVVLFVSYGMHAWANEPVKKSVVSEHTLQLSAVNGQVVASQMTGVANDHGQTDWEYFLDTVMLEYFRKDPALLASLADRVVQQRYFLVAEDIGVFRFLVNLFLGNYLHMSGPIVHLPQGLVAAYQNSSRNSWQHAWSGRWLQWLIAVSAQQRFQPGMFRQMLREVSLLAGRISRDRRQGLSIYQSLRVWFTIPDNPAVQLRRYRFRRGFQEAA